MLLPDVNVLVYAHRPEAPLFEPSRAWVEAASMGPEQVGWSDLVLSGFLRIVTNPRIFDEPTTIADALLVCEELLAAPAAVRVSAGAAHWGAFCQLCTDLDLHGPDVADAYLAALAIERDATFVTHDRGFGRFAGLRWSTPLV